jgi:hypothetical protein
MFDSSDAIIYKNQFICQRYQGFMELLMNWKLMEQRKPLNKITDHLKS